MNVLLQEYLPLVIFIGVSLAIGLVLLIAPFIVAYRQPDRRRLSGSCSRRPAQAMVLSLPTVRKERKPRSERPLAWVE